MMIFLTNFKFMTLYSERCLQNGQIIKDVEDLTNNYFAIFLYLNNINKLNLLIWKIASNPMVS